VDIGLLNRAGSAALSRPRSSPHLFVLVVSGGISNAFGGNPLHNRFVAGWIPAAALAGIM
jgi:hypothetical protein